MATAPFPNSWSPVPNLTGNSEFAVDANGALWLVSNDPSGAWLFVSSDSGRSFTPVVALPGTSEGTTLALDPALSFDAQGNLYIIGQTGTGSNIAVAAWVYTATNPTLLGPTIMTQAGLVPADYDIADAGDGGALAVVCFLGSSAEALSWFHLLPDSTISSQGVVAQEAAMAGNRYGSVSLVPYSPLPQFAGVLIHVTSHPKNVLFKDFTVSLQSCFWSSGQTTSLATVFQFAARHLDNRLTVTPSADGTAFYITECYYTQAQTQLAGNILLGSYTPAASQQYSIVLISGTPSASFLEPVISTSPDGVVLAYLLADLTAGYNVDAPVQVVDVNPAFWQLATRDDFPYQATARWLRGTKSPLPADITWCFVAERVTDETARVFSGFNSPPVVMLSPLAVVAQRGVEVDFDASQSYDVNLDALSFSWSIDDPTGLCVFTSDGETAALVVPPAVGPNALTVTVTVSVTAVDDNGNALHPAVTATSQVNLAAVPAPEIGLPGFSTPLADPTTLTTQARNTQAEIAPTITASTSSLTYSWQQTAGTAVEIIGSTIGPVLQFTTNGVSIFGETLGFELIVSDQVNTSVSQEFNVPVAARTADPEDRVLNSITRAGNIANRNTNADWGLPTSLGYITEFTNAKRGALAPGDTSLLFISPQSVLVETNKTSFHVYTPNPADAIVDAVYDGSNVVLLLVSSDAVLAYGPTGEDTDNAFSSIDLPEFTDSTYTSMFATPQFANQRVIALSGPSGSLLLLVECTGYTVVQSLELSTESGLLYGADNVQWVRLSAVESLHSGEVLLGTVDTQGNFYETLISLASRSILAVWDATATRNNHVVTGEILSTNPDMYAGSPLAPELIAPVSNSDGTVFLAWTQDRSDLVTGFEVQISTDGGNYQFTALVNSGQILTAKTNVLLPGASYTFQVRALSLDGSSPWSNSAGIQL